MFIICRSLTKSWDSSSWQRYEQIFDGVDCTCENITPEARSLNDFRSLLVGRQLLDMALEREIPWLVINIHPLYQVGSGLTEYHGYYEPEVIAPRGQK